MIRLGKPFMFGLLFAALTVVGIMLGSSLFGLLEPDSLSYLSFRPARTAFYPLFLNFSGLFTDQIWVAICLQSSIYILSVFSLIWSIQHYFNSLIVTFLTGLGISANVYLQAFHTVILSESLTFSLMHFIIVCLISLIFGKRKKIERTTIFLGLLCGALFALKPAMITILPSLLIVIAVICWQKGISTIKKMALFIIAFVAMTTVEIGVYHLYHKERVSLYPLILRGKIAILTASPNFVFPNDLDINNKQILQAVDDLYEPYQRWSEDEHNIIVTSNLKANFEVYGQYQAFPLLVKRGVITKPSSEQMTEIGLMTIKANIGLYLLHSLGYLAELWSVGGLVFSNKILGAVMPVFQDASLNGALPTFASKNGPFDPQSDHFANQIGVISFPVFIIFGLVSFALALWSLKHVANRLINQVKLIDNFTFFIASLQIIGWSNLTLIAFVNIPTPRYLMPHFSGFALSSTLMLYLIICVIQKRNPGKA